MHIRVLGSAAGGGFPQWNCNCDNCAGLRAGTLKASPRTQSSITLSADGVHWLLVNASPDIRTQLGSFPPLQPGRQRRDSGVSAVLLIDSQIDHSTGLLILRESDKPLSLYCSEMAYQDLSTGLPLIRVLDHYCKVDHKILPIDGSSFLMDEVPGLRFTAIPLSSKAPPYSPHRHDPHPGDNIGLWVEDTSTGSTLFYAPGLGEIEAHLDDFMTRADCLLVDGTFWQEDEMLRAGVGKKLAQEMGHLPQSGENGMLAALKNFPKPRKVLIHINNTNPILDETSPERAAVVAQGVEVAYDGMDIVL